jgi:hypothetical protein
MGTEGVLRGDEGQYKSLRTFMRYAVQANGKPGTKYNVYSVWSGGQWNLLASVVLP